MTIKVGDIVQCKKDSEYQGVVEMSNVGIVRVRHTNEMVDWRLASRGKFWWYEAKDLRLISSTLACDCERCK